MAWRCPATHGSTVGGPGGTVRATRGVRGLLVHVVEIDSIRLQRREGRWQSRGFPAHAGRVRVDGDDGRVPCRRIHTGVPWSDRPGHHASCGGVRHNLAHADARSPRRALPPCKPLEEPRPWPVSIRSPASRRGCLRPSAPRPVPGEGSASAPRGRPTGATRFGSNSRNRMQGVRAPRLRAASMNSRSRSDRTCPRIIRPMYGQAKSPMRKMSKVIRNELPVSPNAWSGLRQVRTENCH